jgi:hypothetical protein
MISFILYTHKSYIVCICERVCIGALFKRFEGLGLVLDWVLEKKNRIRRNILCVVILQLFTILNQIVAFNYIRHYFQIPSTRFISWFTYPFNILFRLEIICSLADDYSLHHFGSSVT